MQQHFTFFHVCPRSIPFPSSSHRLPETISSSPSIIVRDSRSQLPEIVENVHSPLLLSSSSSKLKCPCRHECHPGTRGSEERAYSILITPQPPQSMKAPGIPLLLSSLSFLKIRIRAPPRLFPPSHPHSTLLLLLFLVTLEHRKKSA